MLEAEEIVPPSTSPWISLIDSMSNHGANMLVHMCVHIHMDTHILHSHPYSSHIVNFPK